MRDELLNETLFTSLAHAREAVASWADDYNAERPHFVLGYATPAAYAAELRLLHRGQLQPSPMMVATHAGLWSPLDEKIGITCLDGPFDSRSF